MSQVDYDLLVVGDDPSAFWLLRELSRLSAGKARLAWVSLATDQKPVPVPMAVAERFTLHIASTWNMEVATPAGPFTWNEAEIARRFPQFPTRTIAEEYLSGKKTASASAARALKAHPDLLGIAEATWRTFHYSETALPETQMIGLALAAQWGWWIPEKELPTGLGTIPGQGSKLESVRAIKGGGYSVKLEGQDPISSKRVVMAASRQEFMRLAKAIEASGADFENIPPSKTTRYSFVVQAARNAIPWCLAPWNLLLDAAEIPDVETELTPVEITPGYPTPDVTEMRAWVTGSADPSLESLLVNMQRTLGQLYEFFPFLSTQIRSVNPTLELDTLHSDERRAETLKQLQKGARELYTTSGLEPRTRAAGFYLLGAFHRCHMPYPVGALTGAQFVLKEVLAQEKRRFEKQRAAESKPAQI